MILNVGTYYFGVNYSWEISILVYKHKTMHKKDNTIIILHTGIIQITLIKLIKLKL